MDKTQFELWLKQNYPTVTDGQLAQFEQYKSLLETWNKSINLMSRADGLDIYEKHFVDSLLFPLEEARQRGSLIDLGTGAGFPGIPLKIMYPDLTLYLLEPTSKRTHFLERVVTALGFTKTQVINERAEIYASFSREMFDILTARAVAPLNMLLELGAPLVKLGGLLLAYKGREAEQEAIDASFAAKVLALQLNGHQIAALPHLGHQRHLLVYEKSAKTALKYPRPFPEIKRKPL
ncbi:MAG TPA: 16S rRNA (guanine(527)-N(7))-methyltransferase RsmG [Bacilli bacterium]|nr:16S rRNA (guanine(527)-N(7))-methyltransferase RsmG [Bacilli bacterium]